MSISDVFSSYLARAAMRVVATARPAATQNEVTGRPVAPTDGSDIAIGRPVEPTDSSDIAIGRPVDDGKTPPLKYKDAIGNNRYRGVNIEQVTAALNKRLGVDPLSDPTGKPGDDTPPADSNGLDITV